MTVKVVVTGSYREQEQRKYGFLPNHKERFERIARAIGRKLAEQKYILVIAWSQDNPASQFDTRNTGQPNHPYWQTADYHALEGYLEAIRESPGLIAEGAKVELRISGSRDTSIPCQPFGRELDEYLRMHEVDVDVNTPHEFPDKRSEMLKTLASEADVFIVIGGGKATDLALSSAIGRQVLLPLGFAGGRGKQAIAELSDDFKRKLNIDLNTSDSDTIIAQLPILINLITSNNTPPNQTSQTAMTSPNNGNNEPSNFWSFLKSLPPWLWVIGGLTVIVLIYLAFTIGRPVRVTTPGVSIDIPKNPETSGQKEPDAKEPDAFKVTVNYRCLWKSPRKNSQPVDKATVKTFINGQLNKSEDTNPNGYVSFEMKSTDEVRAEITHLDARDVPIKDYVKLNPIELESKKNTIERQSCLLFAKDKVKQ